MSKSGADYSEVLTDLGGEEGESLRAYVYLRVVVSILISSVILEFDLNFN